MADTDIILSVDLNTQNAEKTAQQLHKEIEDIFNSRKGQSSASLMSLEIQMKNAMREADNLRQHLEELKQIDVAGNQAKTLSEVMVNFKRLSLAYDELVAAREKALTEGTAEVKGQTLTVEQLDAAIEEVTNSMQVLSDRITTEQKLDAVNDKLKQQIIHYREISDKTKNARKEVEHLKKSTDSVHKSVGNITKFLKKSIVAVGALILGAKGFMSVFNKLRAAVLEGFNNLQTSGVGELKKQINDLTNASNTLKNALAGAFEPIVTTVIPYIQKLTEWLTFAIDKIAQFIAAISGQKTYIKAIKQVGDAAQKAGNQAKGSLASFDKLNVLTTSGGGTGNQFTEEAISEEVLSKLDEMKKKFEEIKNIAEKIIVEPFKEGFDKFDVLGKFKELKENVLKLKQAISDFLDKLDKSKILRVLESAARLIGTIVGFIAYLAEILANSVILTIIKFLEKNGDRLAEHIDNINDLIADIMDKISDIMEHLKPLIDFLESEEFTDFSAAVSGLIMELTAGPFEFILMLIKTVLELIDEVLVQNVEKLAEALKTISEIITPIVESLKEGFGKLWDKIKKVWEEDVKPALEDFNTTMSETLGDILDWINENKDTWQEWSDKICELLNEYVFPILEELAQIVGSVIGTVIRIITWLWKNTIKPFIDWIKPYILPILTFVFNFITTTTKHVLAVVRFVLNVISTLLKSLNKLLQGDAVGAWNTLKEGLVNAVNKMKEVFGPFIDYIMGGIDRIVQGFNNVKDFFSNVGNAVSNLFGPSNTTVAPVNKVHTAGSGPINSRGYATGGVIPPYASEHLIKVGDNKHETEVVSPLSTMQQAMFNALQQAGLSNGQQEIVLQLDGKTFMRAMVQQNREYIRRTGSSAFEY